MGYHLADIKSAIAKSKLSSTGTNPIPLNNFSTGGNYRG